MTGTVKTTSDCSDGQSQNVRNSFVIHVLDFSKIEAGKMTTEKIECGIADFLRDTQSMIRPKAIEKDLKLTITSMKSS